MPQFRNRTNSQRRKDLDDVIVRIGHNLALPQRPGPLVTGCAHFEYMHLVEILIHHSLQPFAHPFRQMLVEILDDQFGTPIHSEHQGRLLLLEQANIVCEVPLQLGDRTNLAKVNQ